MYVYCDLGCVVWEAKLLEVMHWMWLLYGVQLKLQVFSVTPEPLVHPLSFHAS